MSELHDVASAEDFLKVGKCGINFGVRNKLFWRSYFDLGKEKFTTSEKDFNNFMRLYCSTSLGNLKNHELINDSVLRKFKEEVEGWRYLIFMMVWRFSKI